MSWLNYHHLLYFWTVAKEGSVAAAAARLRLSQPTVSGQVKLLEEALGERLLRRSGRSLELTEMGRFAFRYAEEIFSLGREMQAGFAGRMPLRPRKLVIGVSDLVSKIVVHRLLAPVLTMEEPVHIVCREDKTERLLAELAVHELDLVLAEGPFAGRASVKAFNHPLGECGTSFFATPALARTYRRAFPRSLDGAPLLFPPERTALRRALDVWLDQLGVEPRVVAELEDTALLKAFGSEGAGIFPGPTAIEKEIAARYRVRVVGRTDAVVERFFAITVERRLAHPAVRLIQHNARARLFAPRGATEATDPAAAASTERAGRKRRRGSGDESAAQSE